MRNNDNRKSAARKRFATASGKLRCNGKVKDSGGGKAEEGKSVTMKKDGGFFLFSSGRKKGAKRENGTLK